MKTTQCKSMWFAAAFFSSLTGGDGTTSILGYNPSCPIHQHDAISAGMVPSKHQMEFGIAAFKMHQHWQDWLSVPLFKENNHTFMSDSWTFTQRRVLKNATAAIVRGMQNLPSLKENHILQPAIERLDVLAVPLEECFGEALHHQDLSESTLIGGRVSLSCQGKIYLHWHGLKPIFNVLDTTEKIHEAAMVDIKATQQVQSDIATAQKIVHESFERLAETYQDLMVTASDEHLLGPINANFIPLLWTDFILSTLNGALEDRKAALLDLSNTLRELELRETLIAITNIMRNNRIQSTLAGRVNIFSIRTLEFLQKISSSITRSEKAAFDAAACAWTRNRMPLDRNCTCASSSSPQTQFLGNSLPLWFVSPRKRLESSRRAMNHLFWEELETVTYTYTQSLLWERRPIGDDAELELRWPDIRTLHYCRDAQDSTHRPYNPPGDEARCVRIDGKVKCKY